MSVSTKHTLYEVVHDSTAIPAILDQSCDLDSLVRAESVSGQVYARHQALITQKPVVRFSTYDIAAALDLISLTGSNIADLSNGLLLHAYKHAAGSTRAGAASHRKYQIKAGIIVPRILNVTYPGDAILTYETIIIYDGSNNPIIFTDLQSVPALSGAGARFTLGPMTLESDLLGQIRAFNLDFGINVVSEGSDSDIWPTFASIESINPVIRIDGIDPLWLDSDVIPLTGHAATHANTKIYLKKRSSGGTYEDDITAEHIKFTAAGLATIESPFTGARGEAMGCSLTLPLNYDGTNDPLVIDTSAAIT